MAALQLSRTRIQDKGRSGPSATLQSPLPKVRRPLGGLRGACGRGQQGRGVGAIGRGNTSSSEPLEGTRNVHGLTDT